MSPFTDTQHLAFLRRIGAAAFVFFLIKGLLWLIAPIVFLWML